MVAEDRQVPEQEDCCGRRRPDSDVTVDVIGQEHAASAER